MSSNFERLHEIINEAYAENFSCLSHWEPKKCHMWASISENPVPLYETQDLSSPNGKPKLLFYDYSWYFFFLLPIAEGNCEWHTISYKGIKLASQIETSGALMANIAPLAPPLAPICRMLLGTQMI